ncbi:biotin/lipoyl-containing protein, partial [Skermanella stibiiresistens]|uniref:biotin/lipoyl-containing protein n=1 Tax=Skermanella stibiiresistens TaxID=913326 RepID=UPI00056901F8
MATEITVPVLGESVSEATVAKWLKKVGDSVAVDEPLLELETDKVTLEVNATSAGTLSEIVAEEGATVEVGALLGTVTDGAGAPAAKPAAAKPETKAEPAPAPATPAPAAAPAAEQHDTLSPAVRKLIDDNKLQ